jgi:hypothetical protein
VAAEDGEALISTVRVGLDPRGENSAWRAPDPAQGASAAFATGQAKPVREWIVNVGTPLVHPSPAPFVSAPVLPTRTHSCEPPGDRRRQARHSDPDL